MSKNNKIDYFPKKKGDEYTPAMIANFFLIMAGGRKKYNMTPLKLVKLVYFAYCWNLCLYEGEELFDEPIVAGEKGPVITSILGRFAEYEDKIIPKGELAYNFDEKTQKSECVILDADYDRVAMLLAIFNKYADDTGQDLSNITHQEDTPWDKFTAKGEKNIGKAIMGDEYKILMIKRALEPIREVIKEQKNNKK